MGLDLKKLSTETRNQDTMTLDTMTTLEVVTAMNRQDHLVPDAVEKALPQIAAAADRAAGLSPQHPAPDGPAGS